jgi:hypothetical protein
MNNNSKVTEAPMNNNPSKVIEAYRMIEEKAPRIGRYYTIDDAKKDFTAI